MPDGVHGMEGTTGGILRKNRWAFSAIGPHDVVFSCPKSVPDSPPRTLKLPAIGIFEVPPGCAARTEDWIFPASLEGKTETILTTLNTPHLVPFPSNLSFSRNAVVFELPRANLSHLNHISELLQLQEQTSISSTMNSDQIHILLINMKNEQPANQPFASTY
jgi:hypothetical protein